MKRFLSEDKLNIALPVPLGSTIYTYSLKCCDCCLFDKKKFDATFPPSRYPIRCGVVPCHTRIGNIQRGNLNLNNIEHVLSNWGTKFFETEEEAINYAKIIVKRNIFQMESMGFELDEKGYAKNAKEEEDE